MFILRQASLDDSADVLLWRNDPLTVKMSICKQEVRLAEHEEWFASTLNGEACVHVIGEITGPDRKTQKIGVCRFDLQENNQWTVSINTNPAFRRIGKSEEFLRRAITYLGAAVRSNEGTMVAVVREENTASVKIFRRNGFEPVVASAGVIRMVRELG